MCTTYMHILRDQQDTEPPGTGVIGVSYYVVLKHNLDPLKEHPVLLALPPFLQTPKMVLTSVTSFAFR